MTKKQFAITAAVELGLPEFSTIRRVIDAIIDALPDGPNTFQYGGGRIFVGKESPIVGCVGGQEPVEVKESQPTSELIGACEKMLLGHWNLYKSHFGEGSNPDNDIVRRELIQAMSGVDSSILGPQQPPNAPSEKRSPEEIKMARAEYVERNRELKEDARKLRIMKAMEDISAKQPGAKFEIYKDEWYQRLPEGRLGINDYYSPKEPTGLGTPAGNKAMQESLRAEHHKCGAQREEEAIAARAEEQRIDKEIAEVERPEWHWVKPDGTTAKYFPWALAGNNWMLVSGPEPEAEKLWEDEIWVNPGSGQVRQQERGDCEKDYHYSGWRRIKVKEVR